MMHLATTSVLHIALLATTSFACVNFVATFQRSNNFITSTFDGTLTDNGGIVCTFTNFAPETVNNEWIWTQSCGSVAKVSISTLNYPAFYSTGEGLTVLYTSPVGYPAGSFVAVAPRDGDSTTWSANVFNC
jgi:hypothetical protein